MFYLIEATNFCNLRCRSCPSRLKERPQGFMTPETFKDIIDQSLARNENFKDERIVMHGYGESLLSPYFFTNLDYLEQKGFTKVDFSTNCLLLTKKKARKLCGYSIFNYIKLSLNSSRKEFMEYLNTGSDFNRVVEKIRMFCDVVKECGQPFQIQIQLMKTAKNRDETPQEIIDIIQRDNFEVLECTIMSMLKMDSNNELLIPSFHFWGGGCVFGEVSRMFHWDGDMVGCCVDNTKTQVYGNVKDGIYSEKVEAKREQLKAEFLEKDFSNLPACKRCEGRLS
ncbi:MAG: radical SAM protein [Patescibacteria group bacterium]|nr:radical SAM protein [Patescibacteria group bacterium]